MPETASLPEDETVTEETYHPPLPGAPLIIAETEGGVPSNWKFAEKSPEDNPALSVAWNTADPLPSGRSIEQELPLGHVKELPRIVPLMVTAPPSGSLADIFKVAPLTHHPVELSTLHETLPETDGGLFDGQSQSQAYS
jgi:hypothetical protein